MRKPIAQRIAELDARKKTLVARLERQERVRDTRRKILLGALVLHRLEHSSDRAFAERLRLWLRAELPGFLVRDGDRQLFDDLLHPPPESQATSVTGAGRGTGAGESAGAIMHPGTGMSMGPHASPNTGTGSSPDANYGTGPHWNKEGDDGQAR